MFFFWNYKSSSRSVLSRHLRGGGSFPPRIENSPQKKKGTLQCSVICSDVISPPENINSPPEKHTHDNVLKNLIDYPPSKSLRENAPTTHPPSKLRNFIDYPPRNLSWKCSNYLPRSYETSSTIPPLEISRKKRSNYPPRTYETSSTPPSKSLVKTLQLPPPSNLRNFIDYPPPLETPPDMRPPPPQSMESRYNTDPHEKDKPYQVQIS